MRSNQIPKLLAFLLAVLVSLNAANAEVLTWDCKFSYRIDDEGRTAEEMRLKVDTVSQRAFMEGNAGFVEVKLHVGDDAFSFTEAVGSGSVQTTTITRHGLAVHSRNTVMFNEIVAAQHFGTCIS